MKYLTLSDIACYNRSFSLSNFIWNTTIHWRNFEKMSVGIQYTRAVDSISANIAEGFGRYTKKDKVRFYNISFGSILETSDWTEKSKSRNLISNEQYNRIVTELELLPREVRYLIKFTNEKLKE